ncbi:sterol desaturase family protein, partial [Candidatus Woesearchaeota archaeon]
MIKEVIVIVSLIFFFVAEHVFPFFSQRSYKTLFKHDIKNIFIGLINAVVVAAFFVALWQKVSVSSFAQNFGLLNLLGTKFDVFAQGSVASLLLALLLFDLWMYWWHRLNHVIPFFWKFHQAHHTDTLMDSTSAFRFHTIEIVFSSIARLLVIPLLGMSMDQLLFYESILLPVIIFHHSNINLPKRLDSSLRLIIVTPNHHRVHHSKIRRETDSNYSSIFSFWDI